MLAGALSVSLLAGALPGLALAQDEAAAYPAEGVEWQLQTLAGGDVPAGVDVSLFMNGGSVNGSAGCNSYFGSYTIDATSLTFPDPFGSTQKLCDEPAQSVEDQYLPALQATAAWAVDDEGLLRLSDADGNESLVFGEPPVEITASDIEALAETLTNLQAQIDQAEADVAAVAETTASIPVNKFDKRVTKVENSVAALETKTDGLNVANLKKRLTALESAVADLQRQMDNVKKNLTELKKTDDNLRKRTKALEDENKAQDERIAALEAAVGVPEQPLP